MKFLVFLFLRFPGALIVLLSTAWAVLALYYNLPYENLREWAGGLFGVFGLIIAIAIFWGIKPFRAAGAFVLVFAAFLIWWQGIKPAQHRDWAPEYAVLPYAEINGDRITVYNIRNFEYRTETDFTPHYYNKTFDLNALNTLDLSATYWMGDDIAHIMLSFGFGEADYLTVSIETRREKTESYSSLKGFFKQYELFYVVGDERDLIGLRTNIRKDPPEDVYLYRLQGKKENLRRLFLDYIREINSLHEKPEFYNTLTTNCTTNILMHTQVNPGHPPFSWKILLSGHTPEYLYELGRLDKSIPFEKIREKAHINKAAQAYGIGPDFSVKIRENRQGK